jgi:hypothetical protein
MAKENLKGGGEGLRGDPGSVAWRNSRFRVILDQIIAIREHDVKILWGQASRPGRERSEERLKNSNQREILKRAKGLFIFAPLWAPTCPFAGG